VSAGAEVWGGPQHQGSGAPENRDLRINKFEILATYTYAKALHDGVSDREAKERGIVAAVMGARSRGVGRRSRSQPGGSSEGNSATSPRKRTLTAETYDQEVYSKLRPFYDSEFLPTMKKLVDAHLSYQQVKEVVEMPVAIGARITALEFSSRTSAYLKQRGGR
jgi:hypothetical protein